MQPEQSTKLYRSYVMSDAASGVLRHRGKSPRQAAFFFRNPEVNFQAAQLASLLVLHGLLGGTAVGIEPHYRVGSLDSGALFCRAYETYTDLHAPAAISFEHAWFLLLALARGDELGMEPCAVCGGVRLKDLLSRHHTECASCAAPGLAPALTAEGGFAPC
jgi:hypothetical protein